MCCCIVFHDVPLILVNFDPITGKSISDLMSMVKTYRKPQEDIICSDVSNLWSACLCRLELHIPWYPCRLKFCKTSNLASDTYKCGIKTCRRGFKFSYYVKYKQFCLWDVWGFYASNKNIWYCCTNDIQLRSFIYDHLANTVQNSYLLKTIASFNWFMGLK